MSLGYYEENGYGYVFGIVNHLALNVHYNLQEVGAELKILKAYI